MAKNKEVTKQKILEAVETIILKDGFDSLGINAVAKSAGVDKVLIYRYFDSFDELLITFIKSKDFFSNIKIDEGIVKNIKSKEDLKQLITKILKEQISYIRKNKVLQEILLWELNNKNKVTDFIAKERETNGLNNINFLFKELNNDEFLLGSASLIIGGIYYLILRAKTVDVFNTIDITSEKGWDLIERTIEKLIDLVIL